VYKTGPFSEHLMEKPFIYHITTWQAWQAALQSMVYTPQAFAADGFIHCSSEAQVVPVANRFYRGFPGLVLLEIDPELVPGELRWENLEGGTELFPHLYGPLPVEAVLSALDFPPRADGSFIIPE
jgi:uncharacterized protein (DUF952 family)